MVQNWYKNHFLFYFTLISTILRLPEYAHQPSEDEVFLPLLHYEPLKSTYHRSQFPSSFSANYTNLQKGIHETTEYLEVFLRNLLRLYIRRTGSNSKCISSDNYTSAVKKELQQLSTFSQIKEIRDKELNSVILSHLEMSEDLVEGIKSEWEQKKIFKKQIKGDDGTTLIEDSYCTRSYVREIILRYCQNRTFFRTIAIFD